MFILVNLPTISLVHFITWDGLSTLQSTDWNEFGISCPTKNLKIRMKFRAKNNLCSKIIYLGRNFSYCHKYILWKYFLFCDKMFLRSQTREEICVYVAYLRYNVLSCLNIFSNKIGVNRLPKWGWKIIKSVKNFFPEKYSLFWDGIFFRVKLGTKFMFLSMIWDEILLEIIITMNNLNLNIF